MTNKKHSDDYEQVSSYISLELALDFKSICTRLDIFQSDALEQMTQDWIAKKTSYRRSVTSQKAKPETIADLVNANRAKLRNCGVKNLQALAKGEALPTPGDFAIITSALNLPEEERKKIWQKNQRNFHRLRN
jgi:predicted YcjX-like family ATPase